MASILLRIFATPFIRDTVLFLLLKELKREKKKERENKSEK